MPLDFIPLLTDTVSSSRAIHTAALPGGTARQDAGFVALFPAGAAAMSPPARTGPAPAHERLPVVTLKRDGDRVTRIQVRCSCGEVVELDCVY